LPLRETDLFLRGLYLGVHFPHDVLAGWLLGAAILVLFVRWAKPLAAWLLRPPFGAQLALDVCHLVGCPAPCLVDSTRTASFSVAGSWAQRAARYLPGVIGVMLLYFGLDTSFA
jgi:membrane-associated phospholipid phosphatase